MPLPTMRIGDRRIGRGQPVYIVAEVSANHNRDYEQAVEIIHAARASGADAVKVQTYTPDTLTIRSDEEAFRIGGGTAWDGRTLYDLYSEASMPWEWQPKLQKVAGEVGLDFFSTAFDRSSVDFLERLHVPVHKAASFEIVDLALIEKLGATTKPLILSTGMATLEEITEAVEAARHAGAASICLLKCTSAYPACPDEMNLKTITDLERVFRLPVGLSDHTVGLAVPVAAVALGACVIEKHLTLSRSLPGPDSAFSLEPSEYKAMAHAVREAERSLGEVRYGPSDQESPSLVFRRSLFVVTNVSKGELLTEASVRSIRPGHGLAPKCLAEVVGREAATDIKAGTPLAWDLVR